jgi:hypothetical protein
MICIKVCPNACGCVTIFWTKSAHTIEREFAKHDIEVAH